jgi:methylglutaconyl-CoA hydratase
MLTGRRIKGIEAEEYKLINKSFSGDEMENHVDELIGLLRTSGPKAMSHCKTLLNDVSNNWDMKTALSQTARMIAEIRASEEGQEGMAAFLEKRKPKWVSNNEK